MDACRLADKSSDDDGEKDSQSETPFRLIPSRPDVPSSIDFLPAQPSAIHPPSVVKVQATPQYRPVPDRSPFETFFHRPIIQLSAMRAP